MIYVTKNIYPFAVLSLLVLLPACWPFDKKSDETAPAANLYVINVLDTDSYSDCHIAGSKNVPFEEVEKFAQDLDRNAEVVVYCANYMCTASGEAARKLKDMGFANVWAYEGGTAQWYQMNQAEQGKYPVNGTCKAGYLAAANEAPAEHDASIPVISAIELREKMVANGLLA